MKRKKHSHRTATLLHDGKIDVDGTVHGSLSAAATFIASNPRNGWRFFYVDPAKTRSLADVFRDYVEQLSLDVDDPEGPDDDDEG